MTRGIDVSRWQGAVDWSAVRSAGIEFAYVNCSNQEPDVHYRGARAAGLAAGLYYRAAPTGDPYIPALALAGHVARLDAAGPGRLPPCLDVEDDGPNPAGWTRDCLRFVRAILGQRGRRLTLYSGAWYLRHRLDGASWADPDTLLWVADYGAAPGGPGADERVAIHQHSNTGRVPGVLGDVDLNVATWPLDRITDSEEDRMRIIPRAEWGARYPAGFGPAPLPVDQIWLHHTAMAAPAPDAPLAVDCAAVRTVERVGQDRFGGGISYTFLVLPSGRIFEGHGVGRRGAHTAGRNTVARAICLHGEHSRTAPTAAQLDAVAWLLREGVARGWWRSPRLSGGHRDVKSTACPGDAAYALIGEINRRAAGPRTEEGFMAGLSDAEQRELLAAVRDLRDLRFPGYPPDAPHPGGAVNAILSVWRQTFFDTALGQALVGEVDAAALAQRIVAAGVGQAVADELAHRLGGGS